MIKCHFCKHELEEQYDGDPQTRVECPNGHAALTIHHGEIVAYTVYWDVDPDANERYKLIGQQGSGTHLLYSPVKNKRGRGYHSVFETSSFVTIPVREDTLQLDNLVMRLKKMGAFS